MEQTSAWDIVGEAMRAAALAEQAEVLLQQGEHAAAAAAAAEACECFEALRLRALKLEVSSRSNWLQDNGADVDVVVESSKRKRTRRRRQHRKALANGERSRNTSTCDVDMEGGTLEDLPGMEGDDVEVESVEERTEADKLRVGLALRVVPGANLVLDEVEYYCSGDIGVITSFLKSRTGVQDRFCINWERSSKSTIAHLGTWRKSFSLIKDYNSDAPTDLPSSSEEVDFSALLAQKATMPRSASWDLLNARGIEDVNWEVRNTFVELPGLSDPSLHDLHDFLPKRGWQSAPATPRGHGLRPTGTFGFEEAINKTVGDDDEDDEEEDTTVHASQQSTRNRRRRVRTRNRRKKSAAAAAAAAAAAEAGGAMQSLCSANCDVEAESAFSGES